MFFSSLSTSLFSFNFPFSKNLFNSLTSISNIFSVITMSRRNRSTANISTSFSDTFCSTNLPIIVVVDIYSLSRASVYLCFSSSKNIGKSLGIICVISCFISKFKKSFSTKTFIEFFMTFFHIFMTK